MKKYILSFSIIISAVIFSVAIISTAAAQSNSTSSDAFSNLTYPITELGNCKDRNDCKVYCDDATNTAACVSYAERKNLLSEEELKVAKNFIASGSKGPGNCTGKKECQVYCEDKSHIDECVAYAEEKGLMSVQELQKAKKVQAAIKKGVKFPSCNTKKECDAYCEESSHMEECVTFAQQAGLLSDEELRNTQKVLTAVKQGVKPPPCKGKDACNAYCAEASHADECVNFAVAAGIVTSDEARIIKETGGRGPDGCKNKSECDAYCGNEANRQTCMNFAIEHNIPQPQQPQQSGTGPGNGAGQGQGGPGAGAGSGNEAGQGKGGSGEGTGPGNGAKQGGGGGTGPGLSPTKCSQDCQEVGTICLATADAETKACSASGESCRRGCDDLYANIVDDETRQSEQHRCAFTKCESVERACHDRAEAESSACTTTKDQCVIQCQKTSKPAKPTQPTKPTEPTRPNQPSQLGQPSEPSQPSQPSRPSRPDQSTQNQPTLSQAGPGGCTTVEKCEIYCQSHPEAKVECQRFKQSQKQGQSGQNQSMQGLNNQQSTQPSQPTPPQPPSSP